MTQDTRHHESIAEAIAPPPRRLVRPSDFFVKAVGLLLLVATIAVIIAGPAFMSIFEFVTLEVGLVMLCVFYGAYLAIHFSRGRVDLERAYSAHLEELSQRLRNMAYRDALTGLYNHRYFYEQLSHEVERAMRYGQSLAVVLMDMDNFKLINDTYGHMAGDKFLGMVGETIARQIRASDIAARYGGDEFVIILPSTTPEEAFAAAEKLQAAVAASASMSGIDENIRLGISFGVASCPVDSRLAGELLQLADKRLYQVKSRRPSHRGRGAA